MSTTSNDETEDVNEEPIPHPVAEAHDHLRDLVESYDDFTDEERYYAIQNSIESLQNGQRHIGEPERDF